MDVVIIEDELPASNRLQRLLQEIDPKINTKSILTGVQESVLWFKNNLSPDLCFMDIELSDGDSFSIFQSVQIDCPVIFITAFDAYAIKAFKVNSIDYLLKPLKKNELIQAINKFKNFKPGFVPDLRSYEKIENKEPEILPKRLLLKYGNALVTIDINNAAYFYKEERNIMLRTFDNRDLPVDQNLDQIQQLLDPAKFFRINRQVIVNIEAIESMYAYSKSRVKLNLKPEFSVETIVATNRSSEFKLWLEGKL